MKTKECNKCGKDKPLSRYHKHNSTKDKLRNHCINCTTALMRRYRKEGSYNAKGEYTHMTIPQLLHERDSIDLELGYRREEVTSKN